MARTQGQGALSGWAEHAAVLPWWLALALAAGSYLGLHALADMSVAASEQPTAAVYLKMLATVLQFALPLIFLALAVVSAYARRSRQRPVAAAPQAAATPAAPTRVRPPQRSGTSTYMACPKCGSMMYIRKTPDGEPDAGKPYWGCSRYPLCKETLEV